MSKRKSIVCLLIAVLAFLFVPIFSVASAASEEPVTLYIFHGSTCPHCQEAMAFFKKLLKNNEYKDMFRVRAIEIWKDADNSALANKACEVMGDEPINGAVPYIVVGDKTFGGYSSSSDESIKAAIKDAYENNKEDKLKSLVGNAGELLEAEESTVLTTVIVLVVALAIIGGTIYFARSGEEEEVIVEEPKEKEEKQEIVEEKVVEEKKTNTENKKNNTKKSTKKKGTKHKK